MRHLRSNTVIEQEPSKFYQFFYVVRYYAMGLFSADEIRLPTCREFLILVSVWLALVIIPAILWAIFTFTLSAISPSPLPAAPPLTLTKM